MNIFYLLNKIENTYLMLHNCLSQFDLTLCETSCCLITYTIFLEEVQKLFFSTELFINSIFMSHILPRNSWTFWFDF